MIDGVARPVPQSAGVSQTGRRVVALTIAVLVAVAIRAVLLPAAGLPGDLDAFAQWVGHISNNGLSHAYDEELTFGPVMTYIWWALGLVEPGFRTAIDSSDPGLRMLLKLPAVLADFGLAACVAWILRATPGWAVVGAVVVLLHPATWYVSAWWGQYESIYVLIALLAVLFAVSGRDGLAAAALAVAVLTKPQALPFLVPFAAWFFARGGGRRAAPRRGDRRRRRGRPVASLRDDRWPVPLPRESRRLPERRVLGPLRCVPGTSGGSPRNLPRSTSSSPTACRSSAR